MVLVGSVRSRRLIFPDGGARLYLLGRACPTAGSHVVKTRSFPHVLKIEGGGVWGPDLLQSFAVLLFELLEGNPLLLARTQVRLIYEAYDRSLWSTVYHVNHSRSSFKPGIRLVQVMKRNLSRMVPTAVLSHHARSPALLPLSRMRRHVTTTIRTTSATSTRRRHLVHLKEASSDPLRGCGTPCRSELGRILLGLCRITSLPPGAAGPPRFCELDMREEPVGWWLSAAPRRLPPVSELFRAWESSWAFRLAEWVKARPDPPWGAVDG